MYGVDLAVMWRERRWVALAELIDQLPTASRFFEAVHNDPEQVALMAEQVQQAKGEWRPRLSEWRLEHVMLQRLIAAVEVGNADFLVANGGKPGKVRVFPGPETGVEKAREQARIDRQRALIDYLTPRA